MERLYDYYIYRITYVVDGRTYVGKRQIRLWDNYYGSGNHIKNAVKKYGKDKFTREIIAEYHGITQLEISNIESEFIKAEWDSGHGEFNYALHSHDGDIFDGMPEDKLSEIIDRSLSTNRSNHNGQLAWNTHDSREKAMSTYIERHGSLTEHMNTEECRRKAKKTMYDNGYYDTVYERLCTPEAKLASIEARTSKYGSPDAMMHTPEANEKRHMTMLENDQYRKNLSKANTPECIAKAVATRSIKYEWYYNNELVYIGPKYAASRRMNRRNQKWIMKVID